MLTIFGSKMCSDCNEFKKHLDLHNISYTFIDINESLSNLKLFLQHRDTNPLFDDAKKMNKIGIPAFMEEDGPLSIDWETYLKNHNIEILEYKSCDLEKKGC